METVALHFHDEKGDQVVSSQTNLPLEKHWGWNDGMRLGMMKCNEVFKGQVRQKKVRLKVFIGPKLGEVSIGNFHHFDGFLQ